MSSLNNPGPVSFPISSHPTAQSPFKPSFNGSSSQTLASLNNPINDIHFVLQVVAKADHNMFMRAGNVTYTGLFEQFKGAKAESDALK